MRYVALLRGINVGGHNVKMERLRALFEELGLDEVTTFIASGNVLFSAGGARPARSEADDLEERIEAHLAGALGYDVATFVRSATEMQRIAGLDPFAGVRTQADDTRHIGFFQGRPPAAVKRAVAELSNDDDRLHIDRSELYWLRRGRFSDSTLSQAQWNRALGTRQMTIRNANTVGKIAAKLSG
jgi:uncharacterized protein (DUF1697 family)